MALSTFKGLSPGSYGAIMADPPWSFLTYSGNRVTAHRTATDHYQTMKIEDLRDLPVANLAAKDCVLFLWVVDSHLDVAIDLGKSWGFKYKTRAFEWLKSTQSGNGYRISMGYWTRKQTESCLLFTRGSPRRLDKGVRQIIEEPIRGHSRKPDETYRRIEKLVGGPYCELFAKYRWPGWDGWGNEYSSTNEEARAELTEAVRAWITNLR
jgi:N6-adenosine-specific RNA methylase IME4